MNEGFLMIFIAIGALGFYSWGLWRHFDEDRCFVPWQADVAVMSLFALATWGAIYQL